VELWNNGILEYWNTDRSILPSFQCSSIPIFPAIGPKSNIQPCRFTLETVEWKVCKKIGSSGFRVKRFSFTEVQRGEAATKNRNISRKGAKAAKKLNFRTWRSWRLGGSNSLFSCTFLRVLSASAVQSPIPGSQESLKTQKIKDINLAQRRKACPELCRRVRKGRKHEIGSEMVRIKGREFFERR
jgi:hypothetical protein